MEAQRRGTADGGDRRGLEGGDGELLMADGAEDTLQRDKKNLLIRIGAAVDRIISHFNGSRNQVQKAQLGDSRLSPRLGYLILNSLCPSLFSLFCDGLRPFQKDLIIGRRRLSPWNLVEASIKSGPESLHILFHNVSRFQQLRDPQRRFNAFIFGLLNTKQLDVWVCHLHHIYDQLSVFFYPTGFLPLAATSHPGLAEELLLIVQPLSALTFHTDLLFEHHHLPIQDPPTPQSPSATPLADHWGAPPFQQILDLGGWIAQNFSRNPDREKPKESQTRCPSSSYSSIGAPQDESFYCANVTQQQAPSTGDRREAQKPSTPKPKDSSTTWWGQLSQASRLYIPANKDSSFRNIKGSPDTLQIHPKEPHQRGPQKTNLGTEQGQPSRGSGDPAEAIISGDEGLTPGSSPPCRQTLSGHGGCTAQTPEKGGWFGQLFGAAHSCDSEARNVKSRRPSSWLPPNVNVLNLLRLLSTSEQEAVAPAEERKRSDHKAERSLRALCDHSASGEAQLSFRKGDVLQLLGTVDEDWIRCRRGSDTGLVPVGYTSLIL
uniref:RUN and SH3 domain-containing protein 1 n=2 Tax=Pyxicephalus adspersus TaxID=30357 RepID=A0AAV2ZJV1_PYXAD|nr:TPA: hypothetical protein GDO54_004838 [Pyxicephalus adspersus]